MMTQEGQCEAVLQRLSGLADPAAVQGMARFGVNFDSWDVCDLVCGNLFDRTPRAYDETAE